MIKKHKPIMGTRLVPSIENIEGCHKWGGSWLYKYGICVERNKKCTAPIKGVHFCWDVIRNNTNNREKPFFYAVTFNQYPVFNSTGIDLFGDYHVDALQMARYMALNIAESVLMGDENRYFRLRCFTPRGRPISCNQPNAVISQREEDVAYAFRKLFKEKEIYPIEFIKTRHKGYKTIPQPVKKTKQRRFKVRLKNEI